jgi:hypothetical protein
MSRLNQLFSEQRGAAASPALMKHICLLSIEVPQTAGQRNSPAAPMRMLPQAQQHGTQ